MHWLVPFAGPLSEAGHAALAQLPLPNLGALLQRLQPGPIDEGDEWTLSPPHERVLARELGWPVADGELPWAAYLAEREGVATGGSAWALVTPAHWQVGADRVTMADPDELRLQADESRALFDAVLPLFAGDGITLVWQAPTRWLAAHDMFEGLAAASMDRVIGRNIDRWLPEGARARTIRRLQSEVQMLLYTHPVNEQREARGELPVNSFWLSGCGRAQPASAHATPQVLDALRGPALAEDWAAWAQAWQTLDAGPLCEAREAAAGGQRVALTLAGEQRARRFESAQRSLWSRLAARWQPAPVAQILGEL